jgi:hypothetical protein
MMSMQGQLDHLMWAGAELEASCALFERKTGVVPQNGGVHPDRGTHNRLVGLGPGQYFEIIAPDPAQAIVGTYGEQFVSLTTPRIHTVIFRAANLEDVQAIYGRAGIASDLVANRRTTSDGKTLRWRLLVPRTGQPGVFAPPFIDWLDTPHPSLSLSSDCALVTVEIAQLDPDQAAAVWRELGIDLTPVRGPFSIKATLATPKGEVTF